MWESAGIVAVEGLVEGGNGERATVPLEQGDALVAAASEGRTDETGVTLEGCTFDAVIEQLSSLDPAVGVVVQARTLARGKSLGTTGPAPRKPNVSTSRGVHARGGTGPRPHASARLRASRR